MIRTDITIGPRRLPGTLDAPPSTRGVVVFAHGSGSSRHSPRSRMVAAALHQQGLATVRFDLLGADEAADRRNVFDIALLAGRLVEAIDALAQWPAVAGRPIGLFGASTGAAAALVAAADRAEIVAAVVSRGGRPDLAGTALPQVRAPTLLIVGGADTDVLALNAAATRHLRAPWQLAVVPGATHLFEEPGALEQVARLAADWFATHLAPAPSRAARAESTQESLGVRR